MYSEKTPLISTQLNNNILLPLPTQAQYNKCERKMTKQNRLLPDHDNTTYYAVTFRN